MSDLTSRIATLSRERLVLLAQRLQRELDSRAQASKEPLAIVGIACRFPGAASARAYWDLIDHGRCQIGPIPQDRWDFEPFFDPDPHAVGKSYSRHGAFLTEIDQFDAAFFHIGAQEAIRMDPQQRILLEVAWEALESSGIVADTPLANRTGVFLGIGGSTYGGVVAAYHEIDVYSGAGNVPSIAAGRLSYCLGLRGPNLAVDTACSSSAVALHLACRSLRARECDAALVCGVHLILAPETYVYFCQLGALSRTGRCRAFDAEADGYVRGEGCATVVLKRLGDATAAGDRILALVRGSAVNHDGRTAGLMVPSRYAQQQVLRDALADADVDPTTIDYVETHGTGTPLGDPIEIHALREVYGPGRTSHRPLAIGSVKTLIGHTEAAAGLAGVIKAALALRHRSIPKQYGFETPSPHIPWDPGVLRVPREREAWDGQRGVRLAAVSSYGLSGTNVHIVLEEPPEPEPAESSCRQVDLLCVSTKTATALAKGVDRLIQHADTVPAEELGNLCYTSTAGRSHFPFRACIEIDGTCPDPLPLQDPRNQTPSGHRGKIHVAFWIDANFSATGWSDLLAEREPAFREARDAMQTIWADWGVPRIFPITTPTASWTDFQRALAWFTEMVAAVSLWRNWGVEPDLVASSGWGRIVAAWVLGALPLPDAAYRFLSVAAGTPKDRSVDPGDSCPVRGSRVSAGMPVQNTEPQLKTPSAFQDNRYKTSHAKPGQPTTAFFDPDRNTILPPERIDIDALLRNTLPMGHPTGTSQRIGSHRYLEQRGYFVLEPTGPSGTPHAWHAILKILKHLYLHGHTIDWDAYHRPHHRRRIEMPGYPFEGKSYWSDRPDFQQLFNREPDTNQGKAANRSRHPFLGKVIASAPNHMVFRSLTRTGERGESFQQERMTDGMALADRMLETMAAAIVRGCGLPLELTNIQFSLPMQAIGSTGGLRWQSALTIANGDGRIGVEVMVQSNSEPPICYGRANALAVIDPGNPCRTDDPEESRIGPGKQRDPTHRAAGTEFYRRLLQSGIYIPPNDRSVDQLDIGPGEAVAMVRLPSGPARESEDYVWHPALLSACRQVALAAIAYPILGTESCSHLNVRVDGLDRFQATPSTPVVCRVQARVRGLESSDACPLGNYRIDLVVRDLANRPCGRMTGLRLQVRSRGPVCEPALEQLVSEFDGHSDNCHRLLTAEDLRRSNGPGGIPPGSDARAQSAADSSVGCPKTSYLIRASLDLGLAIAEVLVQLGARQVTVLRTHGPRHAPLDRLQRLGESAGTIRLLHGAEDSEIGSLAPASHRIEIAWLPEPNDGITDPARDCPADQTVLRVVLLGSPNQLESEVRGLETSSASHLFLLPEDTSDGTGLEFFLGPLPIPVLTELIRHGLQRPGVRLYIPPHGWHDLKSDTGGKSHRAPTWPADRGGMNSLATETLEFLQALARTAPDEQRSVVMRHLQQQIARATEIDDLATIDPHQPIDMFGIDSLLAVELSARIADLLGLDDLFTPSEDGAPPTLASISDRILAALDLIPESGPLRSC